MSQIQVLGPRFRSQVQQNVLGPRKCARFQVLVPRFRNQVLENDLDLGPKAWKWSQNQDLGPRKGPRFRSLGPRFRSQVLKYALDLGFQVQDLGPRSKKMSQIQALGPRFRSQVLENFLNQVLGPRNCPSFQVPVPRLGLGPRKCPRSQVLELLDLGPRSQKSSQIQAVCLKNVSRFSSKVLERSQIQVLVPRKGPRLRS